MSHTLFDRKRLNEQKKTMATVIESTKKKFKRLFNFSISKKRHFPVPIESSVLKPTSDLRHEQTIRIKIKAIAKHIKNRQIHSPSITSNQSNKTQHDWITEHNKPQKQILIRWKEKTILLVLSELVHSQFAVFMSSPPHHIVLFIASHLVFMGELSCGNN